MKIRRTTEKDLQSILSVVERSFGKEEGPEIRDLVEGLLNDPSARPLLSLLAEKESQPVGYILFTKSLIDDSVDEASSVILAPLAVVPTEQSCGVGGELIKEGLRLLSSAGIDLVFVLGHPDYYPRHGFRPAGVRGFQAPYPILAKNQDAWMVQELRPGVIGSVQGKVSCADVLNQPEHWRE